MSDSVTPWTVACQTSLSFTISLSLLVSIESVMPYNHLILCHPLLVPPSIFPSNRVFSNESVLQCSAFLMVQLSHPYLTTRKAIGLTCQTFVGKVMSLLLNMLSRLVLTFLPRSKRLLISWLQSSSAVILEPKKIKSLTVSIVSPSICHEVMGPDAQFSECCFKPAFSLSCHTYQEVL